jgi:osmotically-inducible protein OsmY
MDRQSDPSEVMPVSRLTTFVAGAGLGAALAYFLDSQSGAARRSQIRDRTGKVARTGTGTVQSAAQTAAAQAQAAAARAQHVATGGDSVPDDDVTLTRKVETEIFRDADAPKGAVNVSAVNGVVELRGQLSDRAQIEALEAKARQVTGVRDVRNMLHLPGETPVNIVGTPGTGTSPSS